MGFTDEQLLAIDTRDCDLLVSAAAGSGKTAVLVERIIKMVTDKVRPVDVERLLVVTFTEAAAAELRKRVRGAIEGELEKNPGNTRMKRQEMMLNKSSIMTIHAFCLSVIRTYFHEADLDPDFRVADETETELLKDEIAMELTEELYENRQDLNKKVFDEETNQVFLDLVEIYGNKVTDDALCELVVSLHDFAQSDPWPEVWLKNQSLEDSETENSVWYRFFREEIKETLEEVLAAAKTAAEMASSWMIHEKCSQVLEEDCVKLERCLKAADEGLEELYDALGFTFGRMSTAKVKGLDEFEEEAAELKKKIMEIRDSRVKPPVKALNEKTFIKPPAEAREDAVIAGRAVKGLCGLALEFGERFSNAKRRRNMLDFNDLEHLCIKILVGTDAETGEKYLTGAAREMSERYSEIFIDEYQDSNAVQELILSSIAGHSHGKTRNTFMVGDIKQSIYRFRLANPDIFNEKYLSYSRDGGQQRLATLSKNFRSRENVLEAVNFIFEQIMSLQLGGSEYSDDAALYYGAVCYDEDKEIHAAELICVDMDGDAGTADDKENGGGDDDDIVLELTKAEVEARIAGLKIKEMLGGPEPFMVTEKDGTQRSARYSDIAILLRSPRTLAEAYVNTLRGLDIPAAADMSSGFFNAPEVLTALSFMRIIDNPRQDIPLAAVLYSPVYGFSASELLRIRLAEKAGDMYQAVIKYAENGGDANIKERLKVFCRNLNFWRDKSLYTGVSELFWSVMEESNLFIYEGVMPGGAVRQANIRVLYEYAVKYEGTGTKGLFQFIRYIDRLAERDSAGHAPPAGTGETDAVRIMSIHKSKGLEFPIVFVCGMGKRFNLRDTYSKLLFHNNLGIGAKAVDLEKRIQSDTLKRKAISAKLKTESISEELRVLYVAMTRAREKLILIGEVKNKRGYGNISERTEKKLPVAMLKRNMCYMDYLLQALARYEINTAKARWVITDMTAAEASVPAGAYGLKTLETNTPGMPDGGGYPEDTGGQYEEIKRRLFFEYPHKTAVTIPQKLSVTEIKRLYYREQIKESRGLFDDVKLSALPPLKTPEFAEAIYGHSAALRGTILHTVMERADFTAHRTRNEIEKLVQSLSERGILRPDEAAAADIDAVVRFMSSKLAGRIRSAKKVWREQHFIISVPAAEISPELAGGDSGSGIMVHGVIDCAFMDGSGQITLVDYKTDRNTTPAAAIRQYKSQIAFYKLALEKYFGMPVKEAVICFINDGTEVLL